MSFKQKINVTMGGLLAGTLLASAALADTAPATDAGNDLSEIVVTALKRETRIQETPAAVSVVSDDALRNANIREFDDLAREIPGLEITDAGPGQRRVAIRGIRSAGDSQVGIYYDESPLVNPPGTTSDPGANTSDFRLFDVERVEALRGPQGTLYGAGAMGGAIRVIFKKPTFDYEGTVDVTGTTVDGGGEGYQVNAAINVPLIDNKLAVRAAGFKQYSPGWINNPGLGLKNVNDDQSEGGRFLARLLPTEWLTLDALFYYQDDQGGPTGWSPSAGQYNSIDKAYLPFDDRTRLGSLTANADLDVAKLTVTSSYQSRNFLMTRDPNYLFSILKATSAMPGLYYQPQSVTDWTNEVRLQSSEPGRLQWTVGGYFEHRNANVLSEGHVIDKDGFDVDPVKLSLQRYIGDKLDQEAAFGEVSYELIDNLTFTQGLRFYNYDKTVSGATTVGLAALGTAVSPYKEWSTNNQGLLYKSNLSYKFSDQVFVYFQAASGFRPGGINQAIGLATAAPYQPDSLWTYEVGVKTSFLDDHLSVNLTGYRTDWDNMQVSLNSGTFSYLGNAGSARVQGLEAEVTATPIPGLQITANGTVLGANLTADQIATGAVASATTGRAGDRIPNIPELTATLSAQYEWTLVPDWKALVRGDGSYVGPSYSDFHQSSQYHEIGDYTVFNARVGVEHQGWGFFLFANNLLNRVARVSAGNVLGGSLETEVTLPPRTIGANLTKSF
ncbi:MAG: TonB-dependent receptor [Azospirillaceae bacterium]|nr:TonB-dependent receptor [Azospirillaceae bacterium]